MFGNKKSKAPERPFCSIVVVAAGSSTRMGEDKLLCDLGGMPVIGRTLGVLEDTPCVDEVVVVTQSAKIPLIIEMRRDYQLLKIRHIVEGGESRTQSSLIGVRLCAENAELIGIHDGARPLVTPELIAAAAQGALEHGAASPAAAVKETVRQARGGRVLKTLAREELFLMQTPQVFRAEVIRHALEDAVKLGLSLTDDAQAVLLLDGEVYLTEGSDENIKLTTPADLCAARAIFERRRGW